VKKKLSDVYLLERIDNFKELIRKYFERNYDQEFAEESVFILTTIEA